MEWDSRPRGPEISRGRLPGPHGGPGVKPGGLAAQPLVTPPERASRMVFWAWLGGHISSVPREDWIEGVAFVPSTLVPSSQASARSTLGYIHFDGRQGQRKHCGGNTVSLGEDMS